ncbi:hypothetical protein ACLOJK_016294 [Asimina triloba]
MFREFPETLVIVFTFCSVATIPLAILLDAFIMKQEIPDFNVSSFSLRLFNLSSSLPGATWDLTVTVQMPYKRTDALLFYGPHLLWNASFPPLYNPLGGTVRFSSQQVGDQQPILLHDTQRMIFDDWLRVGAVGFDLRFLAWHGKTLYTSLCGNVVVGFHRLSDQRAARGGGGLLWAGPLAGPPISCSGYHAGPSWRKHLLRL